MDYEEFKIEILKELQDLYGENAEVGITDIRRNNGLNYEGVRVAVKGMEHGAVPVVRLDKLYEEYSSGRTDMKDCIEIIRREAKNGEAAGKMEHLTKRLGDWNLIRKDVYPLLLSTENNKELLEKLVSSPLMDMSIVYIIRAEIGGGGVGSIKINRQMMEHYGISSDQLHRQAMENLKKDSYEFSELNTLIKNLLRTKKILSEDEYLEEMPDAYVLTNASGKYGAAGILDKELLRQFAGYQDYFILPSSIHETIFVPAYDASDRESLNKLVADANRKLVSTEERLSDHIYFYDAGTGEIKMCD